MPLDNCPNYPLICYSWGQTESGAVERSRSLDAKSVCTKPDGFEAWFKLARKADLVTGSLNQDSVQYVLTVKGAVILYEELAAIFSQAELQSFHDQGRSLVETKQ